MATKDKGSTTAPRSIRLSEYHQWVYRQVHGAMDENKERSSAAVADLIFKVTEDTLRAKGYITEEYKPVASPGDVLVRPSAENGNTPQ